METFQDLLNALEQEHKEYKEFITRIKDNVGVIFTQRDVKAQSKKCKSNYQYGLNYCLDCASEQLGIDKEVLISKVAPIHPDVLEACGY